MRHILLIGNDGQVGFELERTLAPLGRISTICYPAIDFRSPDSIIRAVRNAKPDLIVNAAAYTAVDKAESDSAICEKLNADAPAILAEEANRLRAGLVHYSTDFVFDGGGKVPYTEEDTPSPLGVYGQTKLAGDLAVQKSGVPHLIFRLAWIYGMRGKNFLLTIRRLADGGKPIRIVDDQVGCPTWCRIVAEATAAALTKTLDRHGKFNLAEVSGIYNCVCSGQTSWCGFARAFITSGLPVLPITTADYPTPARRPAYSVLSCAKLQKVFGITLPSWETALRDCLASERSGSCLS